jgi:hypothetical protein
MEANSALVIAILYVYKCAFADLLAEYPEVTDYATCNIPWWKIMHFCNIQKRARGLSLAPLSLARSLLSLSLSLSLSLATRIADIVRDCCWGS